MIPSNVTCDLHTYSIIALKSGACHGWWSACALMVLIIRDTCGFILSFIKNHKAIHILATIITRFWECMRTLCSKLYKPTQIQPTFTWKFLVLRNECSSVNQGASIVFLLISNTKCITNGLCVNNVQGSYLPSLG